MRAKRVSALLKLAGKDPLPALIAAFAAVPAARWTFPQVLGELYRKGQRSIQPALRELLNDPHESVRSNAAGLVAHLRWGDQFIPELACLLEQQKFASAFLSGIWALDTASLPTAVPYFKKFKPIQKSIPVFDSWGVGDYLVWVIHRKAFRSETLCSPKMTMFGSSRPRRSRSIYGSNPITPLPAFAASFRFGKNEQQGLKHDAVSTERLFWRGLWAVGGYSRICFDSTECCLDQKLNRRIRCVTGLSAASF